MNESKQPENREQPVSMGSALGMDFKAILQSWQEAPEHPLRVAFDAAPDWIECDDHPGEKRWKDWDLTAEAHVPGDTRVIYRACPVCEEERAAARAQDRLRRMGVPEDLLHATLGNYRADAPWQVTALAKARGFCEVRRGFLVLYGSTGTGKDHLSIGVARRFDRFLWLTHSAMLRALRSTYGKSGDATEEQIAEWASVPLLVVSELGVSTGGKDEEPLLYDVLAARYDRRLPTIINTNLDPDGEGLTIYGVLGARLTSRIRGSIYAFLPCKGADHRIEKRTDYFS